MNSLTDLVDVVIGVDTHVLTHTAAVVDTGTGGVLAQLTVGATAAGYAELVEFADEHGSLRAWAIEGTGGHGAGLTRHLEAHDELVIELDRPERAQRRNGAKSDPLDAIRAAAKPCRVRVWAPHDRPVTGRRCPCCWRHAGPRSMRLPTRSDRCSASSSPRRRPSG